jgi:hypothetical protein
MQNDIPLEHSGDKSLTMDVRISTILVWQQEIIFSTGRYKHRRNRCLKNAEINVN